MFVTKLSLFQFRNMAQADYLFSSGIVIVSGDNGQGKTNLLEGLYTACMGFSPRTRKEKDMVKWGMHEFSLMVTGHDEDEEWEQKVFWRENSGKEIQSDGKRIGSLAELPGKYPVVWFGPEDIQIVTGGPALRRRFLDLLMAQLVVGYLDNYKTYQQVLKQRNFLLKNSDVQGQNEVLRALSVQLAITGAWITEQRGIFCEQFLPEIRRYYEMVSNGKDQIHLKYLSSVPKNEGADFHASLEKSLLSNWSDEIRMGQTLYGPHRDNLLFLLAGRPVGLFGSQGQKRLCALSLRLAEAAILRQKKSVTPLLLLDDVFAELDSPRRLVLSKCIEEYRQVLIALPRASDLPFNGSQSIHVGEGM